MPGHPRLASLRQKKTWMPGIAGKSTQSAQKQTAMAGHDEGESPQLKHRINLLETILGDQ
jgi:hypothetical protein